MKQASYQLDGQIISIRTLCRLERWPTQIVYALMQSDQPPATRVALVEAIRIARSQPVVRPIRESSRQANHQRKTDYLTKQARMTRESVPARKLAVSSP